MQKQKEGFIVMNDRPYSDMSSHGKQRYKGKGDGEFIFFMNPYQSFVGKKGICKTKNKYINL
jgi:hypothetical protein